MDLSRYFCRSRVGMSLVAVGGAGRCSKKGEDTYKIVKAVIDGETVELALVADGHGGKDASMYAERRVLERWTEEIETELGPVRCKVARLPSGRIARRPEADEVERLAVAHATTHADVLSRLARFL